MSQWHTVAHVAVEPLPEDWRASLAERLGQRPRRIGPWAELALYGARLCLDAAGEPTLPAGTQLRIASRLAPMAAARAIAEQARVGLPMPFAFMQSQPSQMLAALSQHLAWQGDARFSLCRDPHAALQLAQQDGHMTGSLLVGWVEEDRRTEWWRLVAQA
jgi:hypothetical protein